MRRLAGVAAWVLLAAVSLAALEREPIESYRARRAALAAKLNDGITVVFAYREPDTADALTGFRQNDNFYYLSGVDEPGAILLLAPRGDGQAGSPSPVEILFLPPRNLLQERWTGPKLGPQDADAVRMTGFNTVASAADFDKQLQRILPAYGQLYTILPSGQQRHGPENETVERLKKLAGEGQGSGQVAAPEIKDAGAAVAALRQVKLPTELALIEKALRATMDAHREAMKAVRPGLFEYQVAALMQYVFERAGCERPAYAPIAGSGFNSTVLHYSANARQMQKGDVLVLDVGGEYGGYAADITRTLPVTGRFTPRQREIYDIVLGAQKAVIAAIKPGAMLSRTAPENLNKVTVDYFNAHGKDRQGQPLGKYFIHGISHHLGLNVHDVGIVSRPLEPGMVITVEPGLYIPEENLGIRIEDVVLVTETGARVLTAGLAREARDIEKAMRGRSSLLK
jgi:Xaa-Pro aminopeptidase